MLVHFFCCHPSADEKRVFLAVRCQKKHTLQRSVSLLFIISRFEPGLVTSPSSESPSTSSMERSGSKPRRHSASKSTSQLQIKRSDEATVSLQGWLFKQGSDGLMLWKKRWFVLSEFCLFYYKGEMINEQGCVVQVGTR